MWLLLLLLLLLAKSNLSLWGVERETFSMFSISHTILVFPQKHKTASSKQQSNVSHFNLQTLIM